MRIALSLATILSLMFLTGCRAAGGTLPPPPTGPPPIPTSGLSSPAANDASPGVVSDCYAASGLGTVAPSVSISSVTFVVNEREQEVGRDDLLLAESGDVLRVSEVVICTVPFSGDGGKACVDFAPLDDTDSQIASQHKGTHLMALTPGSITISGLDLTWTVGENWSGIYVVLNHWPEKETQDPDCASRNCERDDWLAVPLQ